MKILLIGEPDRVEELRALLATTAPLVEVEVSDGDEEEDLDIYDAIFDLNFDDDSEIMERYAPLRNKPVFVSALKQQLSEAVYVSGSKIRCMLFGINRRQSWFGESACHFYDYQ